MLGSKAALAAWCRCPEEELHIAYFCMARDGRMREYIVTRRNADGQQIGLPEAFVMDVEPPQTVTPLDSHLPSACF